MAPVSVSLPPQWRQSWSAALFHLPTDHPGGIHVSNPPSDELSSGVAHHLPISAEPPEEAPSSTTTRPTERPTPPAYHGYPPPRICPAGTLPVRKQLHFLVVRRLFVVHFSMFSLPPASIHSLVPAHFSTEKCSNPPFVPPFDQSWSRAPIVTNQGGLIQNE